MPVFCIENEGVERRLVYRLDTDEYIDTFSYEMVHDNDIEGLLPIIAGGRNGIEEIKYDLQSMISLRAYLESSMSKKRLLELFRGVISIIQNTSMYLLDSSMLVFSLDSIFIKSNPLSIKMIYLPVVRPDTEHDITELLRVLFRTVIMSARFIVEQDNTYITEIINALNSEHDFSVQGFKALIDKLSLEVQRHYVNESKSDKPAISSISVVHSDSNEHNQQEDNMYDGLDKDSDSIINRISKIFKRILGHGDKSTDMLVVDGYDNFGSTNNKANYISNNHYMNSCENSNNKGVVKSGSVSLYDVNIIPDFVGEGKNDNYISNDTIMLTRSPKDEGIPYITRVSTGENIGLDKHVFRIGKEERYADYLISDNAAVSRVHAEFTIKNDICYLVDEDSLNHTYVNNKQLEAHVPQELKSGDVILFADEEFIFYC